MPYLSRSDWGAVPPVRTVPVSKRLKGVCLHYMGFPVRTEDPVRLAQSILQERQRAAMLFTRVKKRGVR